MVVSRLRHVGPEYGWCDTWHVTADSVTRDSHLAAAGVEADGGLHQGGLQHGLHLAATSRGRGGRAAEGEDDQEARGRGHGARVTDTVTLRAWGPLIDSSVTEFVNMDMEHTLMLLLDVANWEFVTTFRVQRLGHQ